MVTLSFVAQVMIFVYCSNYWPSSGIFLDFTCNKCEKSQFGKKFLEIEKVMSYLTISNYYLWNTFLCQFLSKLAFQIKSDGTRVIEQIKLVIVWYFNFLIPITLGSQITIKSSPGLSSPSSLLTVVRIFDIFLSENYTWADDS